MPDFQSIVTLLFVNDDAALFFRYSVKISKLLHRTTLPQRRPHLRHALCYRAIKQGIRNPQHFQLPQNRAALELAPRFGTVPAIVGGGHGGPPRWPGAIAQIPRLPRPTGGTRHLIRPDEPPGHCRAPGATPGTGAGAMVLQCLASYPPTPPAPHRAAARGAPGAAAGSAGGQRRSAGPRRYRCWARPPGQG